MGNGSSTSNTAVGSAQTPVSSPLGERVQSTHLNCCSESPHGLDGGPLARICSANLTRSRTRRWNSGSAWLRPRIAPLAIMMAGAAGALAGRVFRLGWGDVVPPVGNGRGLPVQRRAFEQAGGIVRVRPRGRGEGKGDKAGAGEHRSLLCAFPRSISGRGRTFGF